MNKRADLEGDHGVRGEVSKAVQGGVEASGGADSTNQTLREEGTDTVRVSQSQDVDVHLRSAGEGDSTHISGDDVDVAVWHSDGAGISVDKTLVIKLQ